LFIATYIEKHCTRLLMQNIKQRNYSI